MNILSFYNYYHKKRSIYRKVISDKNFTYFLVTKFLNNLTRNRKGLSVLDYGCGVGTISLYLAKKGFETYGIDISSRAIKIARKSSKLVGLDNVAEFLTMERGLRLIKEKRFDLIICVEVIEHVKEDKELIILFSHTLKRGGKLLLSTPSDNAPLHRWGLAKKFDKDVGHLRRYNPDTLKSLFKDSELVIKEINKVEGLLRNSLYLFPLLEKFIKFIRGPLVDIVTFLDSITLAIFGESDFILIAQKK